MCIKVKYIRRFTNFRKVTNDFFVAVCLLVMDTF